MLTTDDLVAGDTNGAVDVFLRDAADAMRGFDVLENRAIPGAEAAVDSSSAAAAPAPPQPPARRHAERILRGHVGARNDDHTIGVADGADQIRSAVRYTIQHGASIVPTV